MTQISALVALVEQDSNDLGLVNESFLILIPVAEYLSADAMIPYQYITYSYCLL